MGVEAKILDSRNRKLEIKEAPSGSFISVDRFDPAKITSFCDKENRKVTTFFKDSQTLEIIIYEGPKEEEGIILDIEEDLPISISDRQILNVYSEELDLEMDIRLTQEKSTKSSSPSSKKLVLTS